MGWWSRRKSASEPRAAGPVGTRSYGAFRVYADSVEGSECVVDRKDNGSVYEVYWVESEAVALDYLRRRDVREERHYVIVETPGRNLGRDMIMIFDESGGGGMLEIPPRTPLPEIQPSTTHCARCGYVVLPVAHIEPTCTDPECDYGFHANEFGQSAAEVIASGLGYRCMSCDSAACKACYEATGENVASTADFRPAQDPDRPHPGGEVPVYLCWVCESPVTALSE